MVCFGLSPAKAYPDHGPNTWTRVAPSVVNILPTWPGHARPGFGAAPGQAPAGSGFFWSREKALSSFILTAAHVIADATRVEVVTADGSRVDAEVIELDSMTDLAIIEVPLRRPGLVFAAKAPVPGTHVCALGHPFGLPLSMSCGVVSGELRSNLGFNAVELFVQTDAAVNPGVSGGALVNADGQLVGMVSAIFTKDADIDAGVNFAVSVGLIDQWTKKFIVPAP
jgi:S1-C subfamily serine protease